MPGLSTHVLDTSRGTPASGVVVDLYSHGTLMTSVITDPNGRAEIAAEVSCGIYDLVFHAGDYFRSVGMHLTDPPFLDEITIRFGVREGDTNYHVPLLLSPYGYSTYRGS